MQAQFDQSVIRAVIGLGNPGKKYERTRHNIGFRLVDALCERYGGSWRTVNNMEHATIRIGQAGGEIHLIKPITFMNSSGQVLPFLQKKGIKPEQIVVAHDELEKKFGDASLKFGGSAKGHNGLRSIIATIGADFWRVRCGIGRPVDRDEVGDFVLTPFTPQEEQAIPIMLDQAAILLRME
jgi:PTH1 family peptidyl-tRNA hydrolase